MNKSKVYSFRTIIFFLAILNMSFIKKIHKLELKKTIKVNEDSSIIHHLPVTVNILNDSLVAFSMSPIDYCIYNYYSGKLVKKISIDSTIINKVVHISSIIENKKYAKISLSESHTIGLPLVEIYNTCSIDSNTAYVFFGVKAKVDDSILDKDNKKIKVDAYVTIGGLGIINLRNFNVSNLSSIHPSNDVYPSSFTGVGEKDNLFFMRNSSVHKKNKIAIIKKTNDSVFSVYDSKIPIDTLLKSDPKAHTLNIISFYGNENSELTICDGFNFFNYDGNILYKFNAILNEQIFFFKKAETEILFYTVKNDDGKVQGQLYAYDLYSKNLNVIYTNKEFTPGAFYKNKFLQIVKENESYLFKLYNIE